MTMEDIGRGELTATLNRGKNVSNMVFFQNINEGENSDPYPLFTGLPEHKIVYQGTFGKKRTSTETTNYNFYVNDGGHLPELNLVNAFSSSVAFIADHVSYSFEPINPWGTIYLPFEVTSTENIQFYDIMPEQTSTSVLTICPCTRLQAYTPGLYHLTDNMFDITDQDVYISVPPTRAVFNFGDFVITGTLAKKTSYSGGYVMNGDVFQYTTENVTTNAFEATLTTTNGTQQEITLLINKEDGISEIQESMHKIQNEGVLYDLSGRKMHNVQWSTPKGLQVSSENKVPMINGLRKGVYILNGRKVLY